MASCDEAYELNSHLSEAERLKKKKKIRGKCSEEASAAQHNDVWLLSPQHLEDVRSSKRFFKTFSVVKSKVPADSLTRYI